MQASFLSILDYGDVGCTHAASSTLHLLDSVNHSNNWSNLQSTLHLNN